MSTIIHTHRECGGKFQEIARHQGAGTGLYGKWLVRYRDLDKGTESITNLQEWETQWRTLLANGCPICLGAGHDHIKGNRDKPCGGCYGLGKVRDDGGTPADCWEVPTVATGTIQRQLDGQRRRTVNGCERGTGSLNNKDDREVRSSSAPLSPRCGKSFEQSADRHCAGRSASGFSDTIWTH